MKKIILIIILFGFLCSCGNLPPPSPEKPYRPINNEYKSAIIGTIEGHVIAKHVPGYAKDNRNINNFAYIGLLSLAKEKYGNNIDVFDIVWTYTTSVYEESVWVGYKIIANGKVVTLNTNR